jgi:GGDEF domain-containing protein
VSATWLSVVREVDFLARIGGDEFGLILEETDEAASGEIIQRLDSGLPTGLRASAGVATWNGKGSMDALVARANVRIYADKRAADSRPARHLR